MSLPMKILNNIRTSLRKTSVDITKDKLDNEKPSHEIGSSSNTKTYVLEGAVIKVYVTDENGNQKCVKQIPLSAASLSILMKVELTNGIDAMIIQDAIQKLLNPDEPSINYDSNGSLPDYINESEELSITSD